MSEYTTILDEILWHSEIDHAELAQPERIRLTYERARSLCQHINLSVDDIANLSSKFWRLHRDLAIVRDSAVATILTIHWNLCMGTIARYANGRPDLQSLLRQLQEFSICGEFMLTELNRGLDARHLGTTATMQPDGSFILNTPSLAAAKVMPPTTPLAGMPRIAVVFARLIVDDDDRGVKSFIVRLHEASAMCPGVTSRMLPKRPGAKLVDHAITSFDHIQLNPEALLGDLQKPTNERIEFFRLIERVSVGTFSLTITNIPSLRLSSYVAGRYSQRRTVTGPKGIQIPIIQFSTQLRPILNGLTQAAVFEAYANSVIRTLHDQSVDYSSLGAMACVFKATVIHASQLTYNELIDRCGWQGLFVHNQISETCLAQRGNSIAEGDVLVLCIKLANELMLGRQQLPEAQDSTSLLARHEAGVWEEALEAASKIEGSHRDQAFNGLLLPRCRYLIQVIGQRMAYEAAAAAIAATTEGNPSANHSLTPELLALYESNCMMYDESWFVQHAGFTRDQLIHREAKAVEAVRPQLEKLLADTGAEPWAIAPILTEESWSGFLQQLRCFKAPAQTQKLTKRYSYPHKRAQSESQILLQESRDVKGVGLLA